MLQPSKIDRMADQYAKFLESIECCAGTISIGLENSGNDAFA
jgi:hypothetical protein